MKWDRAFLEAGSWAFWWSGASENPY